MLARWLARLRSPASAHEPVDLVLYTRAECHLCDVLKAELARARLARPYRLVEVDVDGDPGLAARHGLSVPVLELGGRALAKGRATRAELEARFARRVAELERAEGGRG